MKQNDDGETVYFMDILFPLIGEIWEGSNKEDLQKLSMRMEEMDICKEELWWYLNKEIWNMCSFSFGLGFERLIMFVTGMKNIRDVIPFPRTPQN